MKTVNLVLPEFKDKNITHTNFTIFTGVCMHSVGIIQRVVNFYGLIKTAIFGRMQEIMI